MHNKPFFSIVIPTYNRASELNFAIKNILKQDFKNFEIVVADNNSSDETEKILNQIKDKRLRYFKNNKNLGWILNLKKGIISARGEYVILHGDDDNILSRNFLNYLFKLINSGSYGYIRVNYLSKVVGENTFFDFRAGKSVYKDIKIESEAKPSSIINFIEKTDPFFLTGIVLKNYKHSGNDIIDSELVPWIRLAYKNISNSGGFYISKYFFIASWIKKKKNPNHPFFFINSNGSFTFEKYFKEVSAILEKKEYENFLKKHLTEMIKLFPAAKYSTGNKNTFLCAKRIIYLSPSLIFSFSFWFWFILSIIAPEFLLTILKNYLFSKMVKNNYIPKI